MNLRIVDSYDMQNRKLTRLEKFKIIIVEEASSRERTAALEKKMLEWTFFLPNGTQKENEDSSSLYTWWILAVKV